MTMFKLKRNVINLPHLLCIDISAAQNDGFALTVTTRYKTDKETSLFPSLNLSKV